MLTLLEALAHNILVWVRHWLTPFCPRVARYGMLRLVRDAFHMNGLISLDQSAQVLKFLFQQTDPFASELHTGFARLFAHEQVAFSLGEI